ncbi:MAG: hypothetical protein OIN66_14630 [Candidatus Methanoperedens sp.]|nr:hypothetical protein [Candidatus Methanoperedens sp.]
MPKEEREEAGEKEEKGILSKLKKLVMPEAEKREEETRAGETKVSEVRTHEGAAVATKAGEMKTGEMKAGEMKAGEMKAGEMRAAEPKPARAAEPKPARGAEKPYTYEFYHEIGKKGGEERAREIREEGISPDVHEKLSAAGKKGGPRGGEATKRKHGHESLEEHRKEHGG